MLKRILENWLFKRRKPNFWLSDLRVQTHPDCGKQFLVTLNCSAVMPDGIRLRMMLGYPCYPSGMPGLGGNGLGSVYLTPLPKPSASVKGARTRDVVFYCASTPLRAAENHRLSEEVNTSKSLEELLDLVEGTAYLDVRVFLGTECLAYNLWIHQSRDQCGPVIAV